MWKGGSQEELGALPRSPRYWELLLGIKEKA